MTVNWEDPIWKSECNLKGYIKKNGNPRINLNDKSKENLLELAKKTEKALALIEIEKEELCSNCCSNIDNCTCYRCKKCYSTNCDCENDDKVVLIIYKTIYYIDNTEEDEINAKINILKYKIKIKMFILGVKNNDFILRNIKELIELIIIEKFKIKKPKHVVDDILQCLNDETIFKQLIILKHISDCLF